MPQEFDPTAETEFPPANERKTNPSLKPPVPQAAATLPSREGEALPAREPEALDAVVQEDLVATLRRIDRALLDLTGPHGLMELLTARVTALERFDAHQSKFQKGLREVHSLVTALFLQLDKEELREDTLQGRTVLVVEDDHVICRFLRRLLEAKGAIVLVTNDGAELRRTIECAKARFDCVLIDANLGSDDGIELAGWLLEAKGYPPDRLILMTGGLNAEQEERASTQRLTVLSKPFSAAEMVAAIVQSLYHEPRSAP